MEIRIKLFGLFRDYAPQTKTPNFTLHSPRGSSLKDIVNQLKIPQDMPRVSLVNGHLKKDHEILRDGDFLDIFSPMAGG